jgi:ABC-type multidrug transport system ATPase subunit
MTSKQFTETMSRTDISDTEKQNIISNLFFGQRIPTLEELFKVENGFIYLIIGLVGVIILYCLILYLFEKSKLRHLKKNNEYTQERRSILNKKLENGPRDVYNEWKRVQFSLNGNKSQINNNIALKVYQLNKDFKMKLSEMVKRRKEEMKKNEISDESNSNSNSNNKDRKNKKANIKKTAFEKMDNRITFDKKHNVYINRIVDDVTFGVNNGECLGLLGPNGAGKTTSINMITGLMSHTHGAVVYGNKDLNVTDTADLSLGYCSQHDSLWKLLTVKETINFYLNICGYPSKDIPRYTKALIEACGIENHTNKKVSEISGGTKRKLSLIIAICSSPSYLILDEPSAGMDPFTRRYMWKLISELKEVRETATILTTHSTEEAEALCDRIAILIKGRLVCIDTPKSIKMNQSDKYVLEVFTDHPEQFENEIVKNNNLFGLVEGDETYELESTISYQKYTIKMKTENIARVFALMERAKENRLISQYNFGQYSLEQVFINFVNQTE